MVHLGGLHAWNMGFHSFQSHNDALHLIATFMRKQTSRSSYDGKTVGVGRYNQPCSGLVVLEVLPVEGSVACGPAICSDFRRCGAATILLKMREDVSQ